jgi:hypothetical protein
LDKVLLGFVVFSVCAISFLSYANADEVPWEDSRLFNGTTPECNELWTDEHGLMTCKWHVTQKPLVGATQGNLTQAEQDTLDKIKEQKESGEYSPKIDLSYLEKPSSIPKSKFSDSVPASCTRTNPTPSDIEECNLDTKMSFCERGIQSTSPIQQYEYFNVSTYVPRDDLQIDLNNGAKPIVSKLKAYEECRAELRLIIDLNETHYVGISKEIAKGEYNPYHRDFATTEDTFPSGHLKADDTKLQRQESIGYEKLCANEQIDQKTRKYVYSCPFEYEGTYKNQTGMTNFEKKLINSDPMVEYFKYKETDGVNYYPSWMTKHYVTITGMSPNAQISLSATED